jgi:signal transduction histidine kinase
MQIKRVPLILIASTLSIIALVVIQFYWMQHSKQLSEEAFESRVSTALCSTVEGYYGVPTCKDSVACAKITDNRNQAVCKTTNSGPESDSSFMGSIVSALDFYEVDEDYYVSFSDTELQNNKTTDTYQFPITGANDTNSAFINLIFPGKQKDLTGQSRFMLLSSILVLIFITSVFFFANWMLWKQKRQSEINIDFFNNTAHEFRTPLTNILLATKMISRKNQLPQDNQFLQIIRKESSKLMAQSEKVLYLAKLENGEYQLQKEAIKLEDVLQDVIADMDIQIQDRNAKVQLKNIDAGLEIFADKLHVSNVFRNLLDNALKYSDQSPIIEVSAEKTAKGVSINFKDNGVGIPKSDQQYIFDKFQRIGNGNVHHRKGFGLGLTYVKMIMELHNGFVKVMSSLNEGSRFSLFLPVENSK